MGLAVWAVQATDDVSVLRHVASFFLFLLVYNRVLCELCEKLHSPEWMKETKVIHDIGKWFMPRLVLLQTMQSYFAHNQFFRTTGAFLEDLTLGQEGTCIIWATRMEHSKLILK